MGQGSLKSFQPVLYFIFNLSFYAVNRALQGCLPIYMEVQKSQIKLSTEVPLK